LEESRSVIGSDSLFFEDIEKAETDSFVSTAPLQLKIEDEKCLLWGIESPPRCIRCTFQHFCVARWYRSQDEEERWRWRWFTLLAAGGGLVGCGEGDAWLCGGEGRTKTRFWSKAVVGVGLKVSIFPLRLSNIKNCSYFGYMITAGDGKVAQK
jgi:hypothetical protein